MSNKNMIRYGLELGHTKEEMKSLIYSGYDCVCINGVEYDKINGKWVKYNV